MQTFIDKKICNGIKKGCGICEATHHNLRTTGNEVV